MKITNNMVFTKKWFNTKIVKSIQFFFVLVNVKSIHFLLFLAFFNERKKFFVRTATGCRSLNLVNLQDITQYNTLITTITPMLNNNELCYKLH